MKLFKRLMKEVYDDGAVGWGMWIIVCILCIWPGIELVLAITYDTIPMGGRVATGVFFGGIIAAVITWLMNDILFRLIVRPRAMAEEAAKKKEKKKAKRK